MKHVGLNLIRSFLTGLAILLFSCVEPQAPRLTTAEARNNAMYFLGLRTNAAQVQGVMSNSNTQTGGGATNGRFYANSFMEFTNAQSATDSIPAPFVSCAQITESENPDGSYNYEKDYGTGCLEPYGLFFFGKVKYIKKTTAQLDSPVWSITYTGTAFNQNFGGHYFDGIDTMRWSVDGKTTYAGNYRFNYVTPSVFSVYTLADSSRYTANNLVYTYEGNTSFESTTERSRTVASSYRFSFDSGDFFNSSLLEPLVLDYSCGTIQFSGAAAGIPPLTNYISGRELISYSKNGATGSFEINYGTGTCDTIITIIENGSSFEIDLSKEMVSIKDLVQ